MDIDQFNKKRELSLNEVIEVRRRDLDTRALRMLVAQESKEELPSAVIASRNCVSLAFKALSWKS